MIHNDRIYGKIKINEPVIVEIIKSEIFQRLRKISQDGASHFIQPTRNVTRYEHSIGVWYLSHLYKRSIEEQVAALIHDISHTAFSHVADVVFQDIKGEYADKRLNSMILNSEIPKILKRNHLELEKVLDKSKFPLLDNELPDISVDRWDYFMRDGFMMGFLPMDIISKFLSNIFEKNDIFYFKDKSWASTFALMFISFSRLIWLDPTSHGSYFLLAEILRTALQKKIITEDDFFLNDEVLMAKLKASNDKQILKIFEKLSPGKEFIYVSKAESDYFGPNKPRFVDPFVKTEKGLERISTLVPSLSYYFQEFSDRYKYIGVKQV